VPQNKVTCSAPIIRNGVTKANSSKFGEGLVVFCNEGVRNHMTLSSPAHFDNFDSTYSLIVPVPPCNVAGDHRRKCLDESGEVLYELLRYV